MSNGPVDAVAEINSSRGASELGSEQRVRRPGAKVGMIVLIFIALGVGSVVTWAAWKKSQGIQIEDRESEQTVSREIPDLKIQPLPEPEVDKRVFNEPPPPVEYVEMRHDEAPAEPDPIRQRMLSSTMGVGVSQGDNAREGQQASAQPAQPAQPGSASQLQQGGTSGGGELANNLQPMVLRGSSANVLPNRDFIITQGTMLDCGLNTRLVTTVPGMISCYLTRPAYSANGRVKLLDPGSKITGHYQNGITQGEARIFVQWGRIETPKGVIINIASAGTGPLGAGGVGGWVDTHFWERFGSAILVSMIGDIGDYISNKADEGAENGGVNFSNTTEGGQDAMSKILENTMDIPPTLYKNHGERVGIFVTRDLDFSHVYTLSSKQN